MYEIINKQFQSGNSLIQRKYHYSLERKRWPKLHSELLPASEDYYHELNPFFLSNIHNSDLLNFSDVLTVRDGYISFASFLLNHHQKLPYLGTKLFLVHPRLIPLIPEDLLHQFGMWRIIQKNPIPIEEAGQIILYGILNEDNIGDLNRLNSRLQMIANIKKEAQVSVYLPVRKNIFTESEKEFLLVHQVMESIKNALPNRKLNILTSEAFFSQNSLVDTFVVDLAADQFLISDNYVHYFVLSRGGTINIDNPKESPKSIFSFDLSFYHELHISPLPTTLRFFDDLLFYKESNPHIQNYARDPLFQDILKSLLRREARSF